MTETYNHTRGKLEHYFDRTAAKTWERLTSDAPVSRIRQTVRAGRDRMRIKLLYHLPHQLEGRRILDAGCGAGQMAIELAQRGADVVAVDISTSLLGVAQQRTPAELAHRIDYRTGDMLDETLGSFDHVIAMDSLIHYTTSDIVRALTGLARRTRQSIHFTVAPRTPLLSVMHMAGKLFPRGDRSPAIQPTSDGRLRRAIAVEPSFRRWKVPPGERVKSGFYISQAMRLVR
jgi:magnesium-protoporphyrin O-methyltransferase